MACCVLTAYIMNRIIKACEVLDLNIIKIQYNDFDNGPTYSNVLVETGGDSKVNATKLAIDGMTCAACTSAIEGAVKKLSGVQRIAVSLPLAKATVIHDSACTPVEDVVSAIESVGYGATAGERTAQQNLEISQQAEELGRLKSAFSNAATMSCIIVTVDWLSKFSLLSICTKQFLLLSASLGCWVQLVEASWIHERAWSKGWSSPLTMDTLISLSLTCGLALSCFNVCLHGTATANQYFSSGSLLTLVVIGGRYLDTLFRRQTNTSLAGLHRLQSQMTMVQMRNRKSEDKEQPEMGPRRVPAVLLQPRDEIMIEPGSIIPCDSYVLEGTSIIDQSTMTGESVPVTKNAGDFLMSGTSNLSNEMVAIVAREQGDSSLEQLVSSISTATEESRGEGDGNGQFLSSHFVSLIILLASCGFCWTYGTCSSELSSPMKINFACERAMAILASACPCALGLATPSAVMTGLSAALSRGAILTGGLRTIQKMANLTHVVMDKTGTLTTGQLTVVEASKQLDAQSLMLCCAAEREDALRHPVARAVFQWAFSQLSDFQRCEQNSIEIKNLETEPGKGVWCEARLPSKDDWQSIHIGTSSFLCEYNISVTTRHPDQIYTTVHIAMSGSHMSTLSLNDTIRPEAPSVISALKSSKLNLTLLTGDNYTEANRVSSELGIAVLASRTLPQEKKSLIQKLQSQDPSNVVAMLGDGINDTPALAAADVGIFLSPGLLSHPTRHSGPTGLQRTSADIILTSPSLTVLPELFLIAQKTVRQAQLNTRWAILYNIVAVALAMGAGERWGVKVDAAMAGTMMALSSAVVMVGCAVLKWELGKIRFESKGEDEAANRSTNAKKGHY